MTVVASQTVTIERHEWEGVEGIGGGRVALTFTDPARAENAAPPPLVFVLHGLRSRKERHLDLCLRLAQAGYRACALDAQLHGERQSAASAGLWGDQDSLPFLQAFGQMVLGTVAEIGQIADEWGATEYGIVGHSMGGFMATVAALADRRVQVAVNIGGSLDSRLPEPLNAQLPPAMQRVVAQLSPAARAGEFWPTAILLLHGSEDETVPVQGARDLYAALLPHYTADPPRLEFVEQAGVGHEMNADAARRAVTFIERFLPAYPST